MSVEFLLTTLVIVATPGTGVLYTLVAGLSRGARASIIAAVGCTLGIVPHMFTAITGLAALLHTSALAFELSAVSMMVTFVIFAAYGVIAASVRTHVVSRPLVVSWMRRVFGGASVALGARLATQSR